jgi:hypothetical protein
MRETRNESINIIIFSMRETRIEAIKIIIFSKRGDTRRGDKRL